MSTTNAIMQRVEVLGELWEQFAEHPAARLACFQLNLDSSRMFELFLDLQAEEEASDIPDLFLRCSEPFDGSKRYGITLRDSLIGQYEDVREPLAAEGIELNWRCPAVRKNQDAQDAFLAACDSLQRTHATIVRHVVVVLTPASVSSGEDWREWLQLLLARQIPEHVRFLVIDLADSPQLVDLYPSEPERVMILKPELSMGSAYLELLREVPGSGPAFLFRRFFVALGGAVGSGNLEAAKRLAEHASRIAGQQQWLHLQAAVGLTLGAAFLARKDYDGALECYRNGLRAVGGATDDVARKVALQAQFAEASALVAASRPADAAKVYEQIYAAGQPLNDSFAQLEGARMAAYCYEVSGNPENAWSRAMEALAVGESLTPVAAKQSTLPFLREAIARLSAGRPAAERSSVQQRLERLLGPRTVDSERQEVFA